MFQAGTDAIDRLKQPDSDLFSHHPNLGHWASLFSGIEVIVNRKTPFHRDSGASPAMFDLLLSAGTHKGTLFELCDVGTQLEYDPGTVVMVCGRVLGHRVMEWTGGERICLAHFFKDAVHDRLGIARPAWRNITEFWNMVTAVE